MDLAGGIHPGRRGERSDPGDRFWVVEQVLAQIQTGRAMGLTVLRVSVNVSAYQLTDPAFPRTVLERLGAHGVAPGIWGWSSPKARWCRNEHSTR